jgi:hypothetical protein
VKRATYKEHLYVDGMLDGKTKKQAALDAGYTQGMAHNVLRKIENKPRVKALIETALKEAGLDEKAIAAKMVEGMNATLVKTASENGVISDERTYPDYNARHKFLETVLGFKGVLEDRQPDAVGEIVIRWENQPK